MTTTTPAVPLTDERELLAKFLDFADSEYVPNTLFDRARALLARQPAAPTDIDLAKIWAQAGDTCDERGAIAYARSVLAACPAAPAQSTVTQGDFYEFLTAYGEACHLMTNSSGITKAKEAVLNAFAAAAPAQFASLTQEQFDTMRVALEVIAVGDSKTPSDTAAHGLVASGFWTDALETANSTVAAAPAQSAEAEPILDWLETEVGAISCRYRGDPSYDHDA